MKMLLIAPGRGDADSGESTFDAYDAAVDGVEMMSSVAVATVAALAPPSIEMVLVNEMLQPIDFDANVDVVGITANVSQARRALVIADLFRQRGKPVVMGGPHVSLVPQLFEGRCDSMVVGELEPIAGTFFSDMLHGRLKPRYDGPAADMTQSPAPRWDLYLHAKALSGVVQTSRGCPFKCTFCDVIQFAGNKQRHKTTGQFISEVQQLYDLGFSSIFIADDNFSANKKVARALLTEMKNWNGAEGREFVSFRTQMSINMSRDDAFLDSCYDAGLLTVFSGLETSDPAALAECEKRSNQRLNLVEQCEKSIRHGVQIEPSLIVGFDSDDKSVFERQLKFAMALPALSGRMSALVAPAATPLFADMRQQGRLVADPRVVEGIPESYISNFRLAQMSRAELYIGLRWMISRFFDPDSYMIRMENLANLLLPPPWIAKDQSRRREPRPVAVKYAATVIQNALRADDRMKALIEHTQATGRRRPGIGGRLGDAMLRYLATFTALQDGGMYDRAWAAMPEPPFRSRFRDKRLDWIRHVDEVLVH